jgi:hypothetical protein
MKIILLVSVVSLLIQSDCLAWGGRGHHSICHSAVFLLKEEGLKNYLRSRPFLMGHLCNIPDFYWKSLGSDASKLGNPAHFVDFEITGLNLGDLPEDYQSIVDKFTGKPNQTKKDSSIFSIPTELGSLWWRADQFFRRAVALDKDWKTAAAPASSKEEQDENLLYNKSAYHFILNLGLMGHFVGDASQPFHSTADYDGYKVGHGGIHAYYEEQGVSAIGPELEVKIIAEAKKLLATARTKNKKSVEFLVAKNVIEKMRALSVISYQEINAILAIDPVKKPSEVKTEKGMSLTTAAERENIKTVAGKFEPFIIQELARSAALLAQLWDEAYEKVGKPKMTVYKSYRYPFTPEFVAPDYFTERAGNR